MRFIFEIGHTHNGSIEDAMRLIDVIASTGENAAVKMQYIDPDRLIGDHNLVDHFQVLNEDGSVEDMEQPLILSHRNQYLSVREFERLVSYSHEKKLDFIATVDSLEGSLAMRDIGADEFKICSGDINYLELIRGVAKRGKRIHIDTGNATLGDVEKAVDAIYEVGNSYITIHHCPSGYPARLDKINLRVITTLQMMFPPCHMQIAFSDHSPGWDMCIAAAALGVSAIEKTLTLDRYYRGPEHIMSLDPGMVAAYVKSINGVEAALGHSRKVLTAVDLERRKTFRRGPYAKNTIDAGERVFLNNIEFKRPETDLSIDDMTVLDGHVAVQKIEKGSKVTK